MDEKLVLMVTDDPAIAQLAQRAFAGVYGIRLATIGGQAAMAGGARALNPDLILLDLAAGDRASVVCGERIIPVVAITPSLEPGEAPIDPNDFCDTVARQAAPDHLLVAVWQCLLRADAPDREPRGDRQ